MDNLNMGNVDKKDNPEPPSRRMLQKWCMELEERIESLEKRLKRAEKVTDKQQKIGGSNV